MKRIALPALLALAIPADTSALTDSAPPGAPPALLAPVPVSLLVDAGSGQEFDATQADLRFAPASVTKVMTAYTAFELMAQGKLSPEQRFTVSPETYAAWHGKGTSMYLRSGESVTIDALLHGITTVSANDAAVVLAEGYAGGTTA